MRAMPSLTSSTSPTCSAPRAWSYRSISPSSTFLISLARSWVSTAMFLYSFSGPARRRSGLERTEVLSAKVLRRHFARHRRGHQAPAQVLGGGADAAVQDLLAVAHHH